MNIEISYGDNEPDLLSQSLTGHASTSLGPWGGSRQKGAPCCTRNDAAQAAAEPAAEARAKLARQKRSRGDKRTHGPL